MKRYIVKIDPARDDRSEVARRMEAVRPPRSGVRIDWSIEVRGVERERRARRAASSEWLRLGCISLATRLLDQGPERVRALRRIHRCFDEAEESAASPEALDRLTWSLSLFIYGCVAASLLRERGIDSLVIPRARGSDHRGPAAVQGARIIPLGHPARMPTAA